MPFFVFLYDAQELRYRCLISQQVAEKPEAQQGRALVKRA